MKIWITLDAAYRLQLHGLHGIDVWFEKPTFHEASPILPDVPWELEESEKTKILEGYWEVTKSGRIETKSVTFQGIFGKDEKELCKVIWKKVEEYFQNKRFEKWSLLEKHGLVIRRNFLMELDLEIKVISIVNIET